MKRYRKLAGSDGSSGLNTCPTVLDEEAFPTEALVQGYVISDAERERLAIPAGEDAVRIPKDVLLRAARRLMEEM